MPILLALLGLGAGIGIGAALFAGNGKEVVFSGKATGDAEIDLLVALGKADITFEVDVDPVANTITISVAPGDLQRANQILSQGFRVTAEGVLQRPR